MSDQKKHQSGILTGGSCCLRPFFIYSDFGFLQGLGYVHRLGTWEDNSSSSYLKIMTCCTTLVCTSSHKMAVAQTFQSNSFCKKKTPKT